jgi:transcription-repair coupling factor (superfamily II helicase)
MDRPVLHAFVRELVENERLAELADALPTRARVSEAALPVVLASLYERLERPLVCLVPEDVDARDVAEAAAWFLGDELVATMPSRGVTWESGLEPPPHLVGERARALDVLARGGLVCASARALAEALPPADARPAALELSAGNELGVDGLAEELALAGYERVERVDDRGQFAVRGGLVDVFPTTGREPLRIEFFGDEVESIRAFSPFTQRALHPVERSTIYPAAERRLDLDEAWHGDKGEVRPVPRDLVPALDRAPDFVFEPEEVRRVWEEDGVAPPSLAGSTELDPFPQSQPYAFEAQRPALAARGLAEAES